MKISVITVCYNAGDLIENTIKSVINQTYKNIEYIIIDGASSDSTLEIIEKYRKNINILISEKDSGIYNAMNKGIKQANGDYLIFMNAGDSFYSEKTLENSIKYIEKYNSQLFFGDINIIDTNGSNWIKSFRDFDKLSLISDCLCHQAVFYKKELFDIWGNYNENYKISADHDFNLRSIIKYNCKTKYIPQIICNFYTGGFSTQRSNAKNTAAEIKEISLKNFGRLKLKQMNFILYLLRNISGSNIRKTARKLVVCILNLKI